jgi:hypothetical protein
MENEQEKQGFHLPIECPRKCPTCGSTETIGGRYFEQLEAESKIPKGALKTSLKDGLTIQIAIAPSVMAPLVKAQPTMLILNIGFEVCSQCYTLYATHIWQSEQPVQLRQMPGPPLPPFMNRQDRRHPAS